MPGDFGELTVNIGLGINFLAGGTFYFNSNDTLSYVLVYIYTNQLETQLNFQIANECIFWQRRCTECNLFQSLVQGFHKVFNMQSLCGFGSVHWSPLSPRLVLKGNNQTNRNIPDESEPNSLVLSQDFPKLVMKWGFEIKGMEVYSWKKVDNK